MRMMMRVSMQVEAANQAIAQGTLPKTMASFVEQHKPEAAYFVTENGRRTGIFFVDVKEPSMLPTLAEPFFMNLHAEIDFKPAMNLEDMKAGVERATRRS